jgi:Dyp-type peroxidase family
MLQDLGLRPVARQWRPVRAGEFLLGYENEDGHLPPGPPAPLGPNGTFMVYRPIEQHVEAFDTYVDGEAGRLGLQVELLRAKIVGRWPDGTPLTLSPERPDSTIATNRRRANDFLYQEQDNGYRGDADGYGCPLGAHIRRSNPRDGLPGGGERAMRHRIIRRGMPYGRRDGPEERGLAFVCFGASISDGFEFIQRNWCNGGAPFGLGSDRDLLLQQAGSGEQLTGMAIPIRDNRTVVLQPPPRPLVTVRGCEYLFLPSRRAIAWLANLQ